MNIKYLLTNSFQSYKEKNSKRNPFCISLNLLDK